MKFSLKSQLSPNTKQELSLLVVLAIVVGLLLVGCSESTTDDFQVGQGSHASLVQIPEGPMGTIRVRPKQTSSAVNSQSTAMDQADEALFEAQGYFHATHRLLQMDVTRRIAQSELADLFGQKALDKDIQSTSIGLTLAVHRSFQKLSEDAQVMSYLEAYARGVNRYIDSMETVDAHLLEKYRVLTGDKNYFPRHWKAIDSVSIGTSMSYMLSGQIEHKIILTAILMQFQIQEKRGKFYEMVQSLPIESTSILKKEFPIELIGNADDHGKNVVQLPHQISNSPLNHAPPSPVIPPSGPSSLYIPMTPPGEFVIPPGYPFFNKQLKEKAWKAIENLLGSEVCKPESEAMFSYPVQSACKGLAMPGSNNWVVSRELTGTDSVYLANDPHLPLTFPSTFVENCLASKEAGGSFQVCGMTPPGTPGVLIGHNENIGWGLTNHPADVDDIYFERITSARTEDGKEVWQSQVGGQVVALEEKDIEISVRQPGGTTSLHRFQLKIVPGHGPVFSDSREQIKELLDMYGLAASYKWVGHEGSRELAAILYLNRASDFTSFKEALGRFEVGSQNFVYGDRQGNIGYYSHGKFPIRGYLERFQPPYVAVQSNSKSKEWEGFRETIPEAYNPEQGFIVTANNTVYNFRSFELTAGDLLLSKQSQKQQQARRSASYLGYRYSPGARAAQIEARIKDYQNRGVSIGMEEMQSIQFDHFDRLAGHYSQMLKKFEPELREKLAREPQALSHLGSILSWGENPIVEKDRLEPVLFYMWLSELQKEFFRKEYFGENFDMELMDVVYQTFLKNSVAITSLFGHINRLVHSEDKALEQKAQSYFASALLKIEPKLLEKRMEGKVWGDVHRLGFFNMLKGILPDLNLIPLARDGSWTTVDMGAFDLSSFIDEEAELLELPNSWGPNFRMVLEISPEGIRGQNILPGGHGSEMNDSQYDELFKWRDGKSRPLTSID